MSHTTDIFVARQPIFDDRQRVFAYELLFRSGPENYFTPWRTPDVQTSHVISNGMFIGLAMLTDGKPAFVNFSREALVSDLALALPPKEIVLEVLESVQADSETLDACRRLKRAGYRLALDDFVDLPDRAPLAEFADFIKVDMRATPLEAGAAIARKYRSPGCRIVAEKIEDREGMAAVCGQGFDYFQGYFFSRPVIVSTKTIPAFRLNYLRLLQELNQPEIDMRRLEDVVKQEASLTFRLLRRVNSAAFGFRLETSSLRHALVLLGEREIRTCATVWAMADMARDVPSELVVASTLRARLCEMLAPLAQMRERALDLFLVGLFSSLDVILEQPMERILQSLPLCSDVREALLGARNPLRSVLECVQAYEQGLWDRASDLALAAGIAEREIPTCYLEAVGWTRDIFQAA
jgi:EAL and modified HD-GYP domain-containing signal transduction protein